MKPLNIALIGCGVRGLAHARNLKISSRFNFIAVCDVDEERVEKAAQKFDAKLYTDTAELLKEKELEAVVIVTQTRQHAPLSTEALEAGKHVLCEKPIADSLKAAHGMIETADETGLKGVIGYQQRFIPFYRTLKETVSELEPVQVLLTCQRGILVRKYLLPGSAYGIMDATSHRIDLVNWLIGLPPKSVFASIRRQTFTDTEAIDTISIQIEYGDDTDLRIANVIASMGGPGLQTVCQVVGKKGNAERGNGENIKVTDISFSSERRVDQARQTRSSRIVECKTLAGVNPTMSLQEGFADYVQCVRTKDEIGIATFLDGLSSLLVAEGAVLSHKTGEKVDLVEIFTSSIK